MKALNTLEFTLDTLKWSPHIKVGVSAVEAGGINNSGDRASMECEPTPALNLSFIKIRMARRKRLQ